MPTAQCLENMQKKQPPVYCGDSYCGQLQPEINRYCNNAGLEANTPVPQFGPDGKCCCGGGGALAVPVEVEAGVYRLSKSKGDTIRATGTGLSS
ncbi:hypothetical protein [Bradyrhizobium sp. CCBAU 53380]|uniref:hypothetical protein n=1 Tax=Bradyrhizobium sp. CCBAU 53380 TaxID=1325117 RepID=UPI002303B635|nr:hypothetical protein [Bradyrhizobium sp. CCBAU 53380]